MSDSGPTFFGKYEILSSIGSGGMATVHRACIRGPAGAARPVALKVIHPMLSQEQQFVEMFLAEVRVAMALNHRNIVQTFDAGKEQDQYYMGMELVNGCSLHQLLRRAGTGLPLDVALFIAVEVCSALDHAHEFRPELTGQPGAVVHCDVSPSNILLGREGVVKLADFGVARALDRMSQTSLDLVKGKLNYMPPEQAHGRAETRSDIFAIGVVLWEMLGGRPLRRLANLAEVLEGPTEVPSLRSERPEISEELEGIVVSCLSADPAGRPSSVGELRKRLATQLFNSQLLAQSGGDAHAQLGAYLKPFLSQVDPGSAGQDRLAQALADEAQALSAVTKTLDGPLRPRATAPTTVEPLRPVVDRNAEPSGRRRPTAPTTVESVRTGRRLTAPTTVESVRTGARSAPAGPIVEPSGLEKPPTPVWPKLVVGMVSLAVGAAVGLGLWNTYRSPAKTTVSTIDAAASVPLQPDPDLHKSATPDAVGEDSRIKPDAPTPAKKRPAATTPAKKRPRGTGQLKVNSLPWAKVYIDGRYVGDTPIEALKLTAGRHQLRLVNPERKLTKTLRIRIRARRTLSKIIHLAE